MKPRTPGDRAQPGRARGGAAMDYKMAHPRLLTGCCGGAAAGGLRVLFANCAESELQAWCGFTMYLSSAAPGAEASALRGMLGVADGVSPACPCGS